MEVVNGETLYVCNICNEGFKSSDSVEEHILKMHVDDLKEWEKQFEDTSDSSEDEDSSSDN